MAGKVLTYTWVKVYLAFYTIIMLFGWAALFYYILREVYATSIWDSEIMQNENVSSYAKVFTALELLQILHFLLGFTQPNIINTYNSIIETWITLTLILPNSNWALMYLVVRGLMNIIRHLHKTIRLLKVDLDFFYLDYIRYSNFILLYPLELIAGHLILYESFPYIENQVEDCGLTNLSLSLPNSINFSFDYTLILYIYWTVSIPILFKIYTNLLDKRNDILMRHYKDKTIQYFTFQKEKATDSYTNSLYEEDITHPQSPIDSPRNQQID